MDATAAATILQSSNATDWQFWWNWWVQLAVAVATVLTFLVAVFGNPIRHYLLPPKLRVSLVDPKGFKEKVMLQLPNGPPREAMARYYHLKVTNLVRVNVATRTQLFLTRIEEPDAAGQFTSKFVGELPMQWRFQEVYALEQTIGPSREADLGNVVEAREPGMGKWFEIKPLVTPNTLQDVLRKRDRFQMILTFQARSVEGDSPPKRIKISWDGRWAEGNEEMLQHLVIEELP